MQQCIFMRSDLPLIAPGSARDCQSLLPGFLAANRTGPPRRGDELTNTEKHHGITSRWHLPSCGAHKKLHWRTIMTFVPSPAD